MNIQVGWDLAALLVLVLIACVFLGALGEYLWHAIHHRRH